ncbi:MAG TPA: cation:proton antiporter [Chthonomonadaceae bacterium]|nr:cation:proton antiporter [Chthonomonadaceae bacterium]
MSGHNFLIDLGVALVAALLGGLLARALRLPVLIGYLAAGIVVGPHTPGIVAKTEAVGSVAELGVALLMFAVGVHFSLQQLRALWRTAVLGGGGQILGTILLGLLVGLALGWGVYGGVFLGCALALSSTAVMMKVLEERGELGTRHGGVMLGILIVQDLSLVLMIVLLPALASLSAQGAGALLGVAGALLRALLLVGVTLLLAMRGVPILLHQVARMGSRELFLLTALCLCLLAAIGADYAGLGLEIGAFLAGIVLSESDYAHDVFSQVRPLRDVFAALFFVSVGMLLDPGFVARHWQEVALVVAAIVLGKSLIACLAVYALGWHGRTAVLAGLGLAQIGEFSFVLATVGSARGLIPGEISHVILSAALITLLLAPFLYQAADPLYKRLNRIPALARWLHRHPAAETPPLDEARSAARVLVLGYGRVGRYVSDALRAKSVPHVVVDYDAEALEGVRAAQVGVIYGDASSEIVLAQTQPQHLELAVVALPEAAVTEMAVRTLRHSAPDLPVVARVHRGQDISRMRQAGAEAVIHAEFEAGTEMIRQALDRLGFADPEVDAYIEEIRQRRYRQEAEEEREGSV